MKFTNLSRTIFYGTLFLDYFTLKFCTSQGVSSIIKENNKNYFDDMQHEPS